MVLCGYEYVHVRITMTTNKAWDEVLLLFKA